MSAHTPGPWVVWSGDDYDDSLVIAGNPTGNPGGMRKLAFMSLDHKPNRVAINRAVADANLIAAAPELYEIVRKLAALRNGLQHSNSGAEYAATELAEKAEQLIAKVTA